MHGRMSLGPRLLDSPARKFGYLTTAQRNVCMGKHRQYRAMRGRDDRTNRIGQVHTHLLANTTQPLA